MATGASPPSASALFKLLCYASQFDATQFWCCHVQIVQRRGHLAVFRDVAYISPTNGGG